MLNVIEPSSISDICFKTNCLQTPSILPLYAVRHFLI